MADKPVGEVVAVDSALDALSSPTSSDVYEALLPFSNDAAVASAASLALAGGGGGGGGSQSVKHVVVGIDYTDIDEATGFADLYLLPDNETLVATWFVVTTVFNGSDSGEMTFTTAIASGPSGSATGISVSDSFSIAETSAADPNDGLIFPGPQQATTTTLNFALVAPVPDGGPVQLVIDFAADQTPCDRGTAGHLDVHLILAVAP